MLPQYQMLPNNYSINGYSPASVFLEYLISSPTPEPKAKYNLKKKVPNKSWGYKDVLAGGWRRHNGRDWADPSPATSLSLPRISTF